MRDSELLILLLVILAVMLVIALVIVAKGLFDRALPFYKIKKQRDKEFRENIATSAIGEPRIIRDLDLLERHILKEKHKGVYFWVKINHWTIPINILVILLSLFFIIKNDLLSKDSEYIRVIVYPAVLLFFQLGLIFAEKRAYGDLRSPVFAVTGELLKMEERRKGGSLKFFIVRGVNFNSNENRDIELNWDKFSEGQKVYVEYSPFTKHIWRIDKV